MTQQLTKLERFLRRKATPQEREDLLRLQRAFDLHDDDSFWPMLFAMDYYKSLYASIPHSIEQASEAIVADATQNLKANVEAAAEAAAGTLKKVSASLQEATEATAAMQHRIMFCLAAAAVILPLLCMTMAWLATKHAVAEGCEIQSIDK